MLQKLSIFALLFCLSVPVIAQEGDAHISYGDTVSGEITNREFEIPFTFNGEADDIVIIEMTPVDLLGDLNSPELILLDIEGGILSDSSRHISFGNSRLVSRLPEAGEYTVLATRSDGRAGDSVGEFTLKLSQPIELSASETTSASLTSSQGSVYFLAEHDEPFMIQYEKTDGEFNPQVIVHTINASNDGLEEILTGSGDGLTMAILGLLSPSVTHIVEVKEALFDFNFSEVDVDFTAQMLVLGDE